MARLTETLAAILLLLLSSAPSSALPLESSASPLSRRAAGSAALPVGYSQVLFFEDFSDQSEGSLPSPERWQIDVGTGYPGGPAHWGNGEVQSYTRSRDNIAVQGGNLLLRPQRSYPAGSQSASDSGSAADAAAGWTSGRIETLASHDFSCLAGQRLRIESRLRVGSAPARSQMGIWPAFWSLGSRFRGDYGAWPSVGEIDVLESLNGESKGWHTLHCGTWKGGPCDETNGIGATARFSRDDWHVVAVEIDRTNAARDWRAETISWFVDGERTFVVTGARVGDAKAWTSLAHAKRFLLLNVAVGGGFPDAVARTATPTAATQGGDGAAMEVDYVGVYTT